jgi:uncharacterized damage-inducible protein DinB
MTLTLNTQHLLDYTAWQREEWHAWFQREGASALSVTTGPHGDGRIETIGALIRHIFSAELRYVERIRALPLTDVSTVGLDDIETLFRFGVTTRAAFANLLETWPVEAWDTPLEFSIVSTAVRVTPRKLVLHVLTHEIRHWAQVGTLLRLQGRTGQFQDLLFSPVLGGSIRT